MFNEVGDTLIEAGPAIPVEISGLSNVPEVGVNFVVLEDEKIARQIAEDLELKLRSETIQEYQKNQFGQSFQ
jgi:translation initiation factor IF-2